MFRLSNRPGLWLGSLFAALVLMSFAGAAATAQPTILTADAWREDLQELDRRIRDTHPRPFLYVSEADYAAAVAELDRDIGSLNDAAVIVRLAEIVNLISDGHTRLAFPRQFPELGLEFGHSSNADVADKRLEFGSLPIALTILEDGVFVTAADAAHADMIGARVLSIGGLTADEARDRTASFAFAENDGARDLKAGDRLVLPDVLDFIGVERRDGGFDIRISKPDGAAESRWISPMSDIQGWTTFVDRFESAPRHLREGQPAYWSESDADVVYVRIDEITNDAERPLAAFMHDAVVDAESRDAKLVIDVRRNTGGSGDYNRAILLAILQSDEINAYGRLFVLTGPMTFSAAQFLVNDLQTYTRALFAGAPTGARPDHFGDSKKGQLPNSGLTLRVSQFHWSGNVFDDPRDATNPHVPAPMGGAALFGGDDPPFAAAAGFDGPSTAIGLIERQLELGHLFNSFLIAFAERTSPDQSPESSPEDFVSMGARFMDEENWEAAYGAYWFGRSRFPDHDAIAAGFSEAVARLDALEAEGGG